MTAKDLKQLKLRILRISRMHFYLALLFAIQIVAYDAWALIPLQSVFERWIVTASLFVVATIVWVLARSPSNKVIFYQKVVGLLIVTDIALASFMVYQTRGMASRAVLLYVVPILVAAVFRSRIALLATAFLSVAAYISTAIAYFTFNFNEGYTVELYGEVGFYSGLLVLISMFVWQLLNPSVKD